jgi:hypothetical protein
VPREIQESIPHEGCDAALQHDRAVCFFFELAVIFFSILDCFSQRVLFKPVDDFGLLRSGYVGVGNG